MFLTTSIWMIIFLQISVISRSTEILIELNFWLGMYVPYIFSTLSTENSFSLKLFSAYHPNADELFGDKSNFRVVCDTLIDI